MGKRGVKPRRTTNPSWSPELAYVCGLMATDGWLSTDGRHMSLTSKDIEQLETFKRCLGLKTKISWKKSTPTGNLVSHVQFGDVTLYHWFVNIGITPQKTFTLKQVAIPDAYFFDYLRGEFDGDGHSYAYWDARWHSSVSLYIAFTSASKPHLDWLNGSIHRLIGISGVVRPSTRSYQLRFAKVQSQLLQKAMYYSDYVPYLKRKKSKLDRQWAADKLAKQKIRPAALIRGGSILKIA